MSGSSPADAALGQWRRMHPVTPLLSGWKAIAVVLAAISWRVADDLRAAERVVHGQGVLIVIGGIAVVAVVAFGYATLAWRMTRFQVSDDAVHLRRGVVFRQQRQVRLDRLQAVDVVRPLLAQIFGLSELRLEVAGGAGSKVSLAFLREREADELRAELLALAAGLQRPDQAAALPAADGAADVQLPGAQVPDAPVAGGPAGAVPTGVRAPFETAPEAPAYELPIGRLVGSVALSWMTVVLVLAVVALGVVAVLSHQVAGLLVMLPMLAAVAGGVWNELNSGAFFRAATSPDGIRLRHGLTESRAQTVPPGRVQAVSVRQVPWWRPTDWWKVRINVAGYAHEGERTDRESVLHPVATRAEVATALWLVLPDLGVPDPLATLTAAMTGRDDDGGFTPAPRRSRWVDPVGWRRHGFLVTDRALILRSGRFWRTVVVVPHERTQSLALQQGPLQRVLRVASFALHSTPGPVAPRVEHLDQHTAAALLADQSVRARAARASDRSERWMHPGPVTR